MPIAKIIHSAFSTDDKTDLLCATFLVAADDHKTEAELLGWERIQRNVDKVDLAKLRALDDDTMSVVLPGILAGLAEVETDLRQEIACYLCLALHRLLPHQDNFFTRYNRTKKTAIIAAFDELLRMGNCFDDYDQLWLRKMGLSKSIAPLPPQA